MVAPNPVVSLLRGDTEHRRRPRPDGADWREVARAKGGPRKREGGSLLQPPEGVWPR